MVTVAALGGFYLFAAAVALLCAGPPARRLAAVLVGAAGLAAPFFLPAGAFLRGLIALGLAWVVVRLVDLWRDPSPMPPLRRVWHVVALFDTRLARRVPRACDGRRAARAAGWLALAATGWYGVVALAPTAGPARLPVWWLAGAVFAYAAFESLAAMLTTIYRALGVAVPRLHDTPIRARSVQEFWGRRWNLIVSGWLRAHCLAPLARRGRPGAGVLLAFIVSSALHAYFVWAGLGSRMAARMAAFFLAQAVLLTAERALRVAAWPAPAARAWTLAALLGPLPLFLTPFLRLLQS